VRIGNRQQAVGNSKQPKRVAYALCAMLFALCSPVQAQQPGKTFRIGFLDSSSAKQKQVGALMTITTRPFFAERERIVELAGNTGYLYLFPERVRR
jgi:hypothetical protein